MIPSKTEGYPLRWYTVTFKGRGGCISYSMEGRLARFDGWWVLWLDDGDNGMGEASIIGAFAESEVKCITQGKPEEATP